jgi:hypothetical protein
VASGFSADSVAALPNGVTGNQEDALMKHLTHATFTIALLLLATASAAETSTEPRQSLTSQGTDIERGRVDDGIVSYNEHKSLQLVASTDTSSTGSTQQVYLRQRTAAVGVSADPNFWFYDIDVSLFADADHDGYYWGIDLRFDADTGYAVADVFAVLYLSYEGGPWNEYAETEDITLIGTSAADDYVVETELVSGYPKGDYDILIELYDAYDGSFLASIGPEDTSELSYLPLEDSTRDSASNAQVVVNSGGGGSLGWLALCVLLAVRMTLRPQAARLSK